MMESTTYRVELARGFLREAQQDLALQRWRSSVSHAQLAVENGLKAVISLFLPVAKTHDPARILSELVARQQIPLKWQSTVQSLAELGQPLGPQLHAQTDYGDEYSGRLPWDLFGEEEAKEVLVIAEKIIQQVQSLIEEVHHE
jgi:HEPN domain-containing protein